MDLTKNIYSSQSSLPSSDHRFCQQHPLDDAYESVHSTDSIASNVSRTHYRRKRHTNKYAKSTYNLHQTEDDTDSVTYSNAMSPTYKLLNSKTSQSAMHRNSCCTVHPEPETDPKRSMLRIECTLPSIVPHAITTNDIQRNRIDAASRKCLSYLQQSDTPPTDIDDMEEPFELTLSYDDGSDSESAPQSPLMDMDPLIAVYGGSGGGNAASSNQNNKKSEDESNTDQNNDSDESNDNNDANENHSGGSGSNDDGDDEKSNDKHSQNEEISSMDETTVNYERFLWLIMHMDHMTKHQITEYLSAFGDALPFLTGDLQKRLNIIDAMRIQLQNVETSLTDDSLPMKTKPSPKPPKPLAHAHTKAKTYIPCKMRSIYQITRDLTAEQIPQKISEFENIHLGLKGIYLCVLKLLAINKDNYLQLQYDADRIRIFNCDVHEKGTNETVYFVARPLDASKSKGYEWCVDQMMTEREIQCKYHIAPSELPSPSSMVAEGLTQMTQVHRKIMESKQHILDKTKWHKVPVYKERNNVRRMKLFLDKPRFMHQLHAILFNEEMMRDIKPIPIIMFGANDECSMEYVLVVSLEDTVDIGISFDTKSGAIPKVVGIHIDKQLLFQQHQIVSPSHIHQCRRFDHFKSEINDIYIGNPDDHLNQKKDLRNKLQREKNKNMELEEKLNGNMVPFPLKLSMSNSTNRSICSNASELRLEQSSSKSLGTISERKHSLTSTYLYDQSRSMSPSQSLHQTALSPLMIPMTKFGSFTPSLPEHDLESVQTFPDPPSNDQ